jgi:3-hydroxy-9,10-secoandrosta-1,3,5(10)-triene-9,17-dione monooxygenase reductase component
VTAVDETAFREAVAHFATGVTVITTLHEGKPAGMTASAVASLSLDPVLLLVCINNRLPTHEAIEGSRRFVVNVLGEGDQELALRFARPAEDKFAGIELEAHPEELPVLRDAIATFVCDVHERFPGGDHSIFIGLVRECRAVRGKRPLVYFRSTFGSLQDPSAGLYEDTMGWDMSSLFGVPPSQLGGPR